MSYKISKDYPRLKQLLDEGHKVVCWVTYEWDRWGGPVVTDIAEKAGIDFYADGNLVTWFSMIFYK